MLSKLFKLLFVDLIYVAQPIYLEPIFAQAQQLTLFKLLPGFSTPCGDSLRTHLRYLRAADSRGGVCRARDSSFLGPSGTSRGSGPVAHPKSLIREKGPGGVEVWEIFRGIP